MKDYSIHHVPGRHLTFGDRLVLARDWNRLLGTSGAHRPGRPRRRSRPNHRHGGQLRRLPQRHGHPVAARAGQCRLRVPHVPAAAHAVAVPRVARAVREDGVSFELAPFEAVGRFRVADDVRLVGLAGGVPHPPDAASGVPADVWVHHGKLFAVGLWHQNGLAPDAHDVHIKARPEALAAQNGVALELRPDSRIHLNGFTAVTPQ